MGGQFGLSTVSHMTWVFQFCSVVGLDDIDGLLACQGSNVRMGAILGHFKKLYTGSPIKLEPPGWGVNWQGYHITTIHVSPLENTSKSHYILIYPIIDIII